MPKKILQVVESAFRATIEEQDDTVIWLTHAMRGAGGEFGVLLRGNAVNTAVRGQDPSGLAFGDRVQRHQTDLADDIARLIGKGVRVSVVREDLAERGLSPEDLIAGLELVPRDSLPDLFEAFDLVWHW
jgi:sulfur relay (sulfurtransferase) DsrF/TusC family protein